MSPPQDYSGEPDAVRIAKLEKINRALMGRVERSMDFSGTGFALFQTAVLLEDKVKVRTRDLEDTLGDLSDAYARLGEARDEAEVAKQNLTSAIEAVSEGFALFDDAERLVLCNAPFRALMPDIGEKLAPGMSFAEAAGLFAASRHLILDPRQTRSSWRAARLELFRKPDAAFIQQFAGDRWIQVSNKKTSAGATVVFQTDITDIVRSERFRREKELDEQSKVLQAAIDHLPQGICMFSQDLRLRAWNSRFIALLALPVRLVVADASFGRIWEAAMKTALALDPVNAGRVAAWIEQPSTEALGVVEILRSDGLVISVSANVMPDGGIVASFADITRERRAKDTLEQRVEERTAELKREVLERRAIEAELIKAKDAAEDADKGKTRFLAAASHDLLQPLNAARLFLSLLDEAELDPRQQRLADKADSAFASVEQLLESLLDISRFDGGSVEKNTASISLDDLLGTLVAEFQPVADRKGLRLGWVRSGLSVTSDPGLLRRIVQNFLSNALRYTGRGGVLLGARRTAGSARIEVWDTGPGIPADKTHVIFEEFRRLHNEGPNEPKAMGLGLAIVERIARLLDHGIALRTTPGKGSCFAITAPRAPDAPARLAASERRGRAPVDLRDLTVIVIENDLQILEGMVELLATRGIRAVPTVSGGEALEALDSIGKTPDLIIADYHLDEGTGLDAIKAVRAACGHRIAALVITADHTPAVLGELRAESAALLHKPIRTTKLFEMIDEVSGR
jgi:two-component system, sensor histidine kinase